MERLIEKAKYWVGYLEKASNSNLDDFKENAGYNNYTCFARDYYEHTGNNYQGQAWCAMFVSEMFVQAYGLENAKKLINGLYSYCSYGVNQFNQIGQWDTDPQVGDVIFFTNGTRAYHTGIVYEVSNGYVYTIEGNTSDTSGIIENGGAVAKKSYALTYSKILGYGRPDYLLVEESKAGWVEEDGVVRFYLGDSNTYVINNWYQYQEDWYWFDGAGAMVTEKWYEYQEDWYYLDADGKMVKGLVDVEGVWYCTDKDGKLIIGDIALKTDENGAILIQ